MAKIFVTVIAEHDQLGKTKPLSIKWTDGRELAIDRILDARIAASLKGGGGGGMRYTCRIQNKEFYLFNEENFWYIEK
jgi:hypothetical protein